MAYEIRQGDVLEVLRGMEDESVQCVVTSPPYWGLRDYGTGTWEGGDAECEHKGRPAGGDTSCLGSGPGKRSKVREEGFMPYRDLCGKCGARRIDQQLGLEATPDCGKWAWDDCRCGDDMAPLCICEPCGECYICRMTAVFREVRRVLRDDGTVFCNMGDGYQDKQLVMMPHRLALALQADGWWVRADVVWHKPNPLPESVTDRPTKSHEYVFLLTKSARYFYDADAVREPCPGNTNTHYRSGTYTEGNTDNSKGKPGAAIAGIPSAGRNLRSVWTIATQSFPEAHFATFPEKLVLPCLRAGTSEKGACSECGAAWRRVVEKGAINAEQAKKCGGNAFGAYHGTATKLFVEAGAQDASAVKARILEGLCDRHAVGWEPGCECLRPAACKYFPEHSEPDVGIWVLLAEGEGLEPVPCVILDPFCGSGTTLLVAEKLGLDSIGIELNEDYVAIAEARLHKAFGVQGRLAI